MTETTTYARRITRNDMWPRHFYGDWIFFDIKETPELGYDVIVKMFDGSVHIWQLEDMTEDEITVSTHNPPETETLPRSSVAEMYAVLYSMKERAARLLLGQNLDADVADESRQVQGDKQSEKEAE
ncbi:hypothetical protein [Caballeronia sp. LZ001]|uniref:hypothetical protein n=1 Tax=Caballeronia sp. LZ001 TaxID=3038553 RepID=UPI00285A8895|nr:hypothetical protein [Caballeronia sp. LZ001]MDR5801605.1 hypothetical protein [Caballeronia sp. LZ001]